MFEEWHIVISGFTQDRADPTGSERLWQTLYRGLPAGVVVELHPWRADWEAQAEFIFRNLAPGGTLYIYAYSWGAGWGAVRLTDQLRRRGIRVKCLVLCDPVYRSPIMPEWLPMNPLSMLRGPKITIPINVGEVHWFYQRSNRPQAHPVVPKSSDATTIHPGVKLLAEHQWMDEHPAYHQKVIEVAGL